MTSNATKCYGFLGLKCPNLASLKGDSMLCLPCQKLNQEYHVSHSSDTYNKDAVERKASPYRAKCHGFPHGLKCPDLVSPKGDSMFCVECQKNPKLSVEFDKEKASKERAKFISWLKEGWNIKESISMSRPAFQYRSLKDWKIEEEFISILRPVCLPLEDWNIEDALEKKASKKSRHPMFHHVLPPPRHAPSRYTQFSRRVMGFKGRSGQNSALSRPKKSK